MKLLVFAHTPPPHHGQSQMVRLMLDGFGGDARHRPAASPPAAIECYHVNARFSRDLTDVGSFQFAKIFLVFRFCLQAIWLRFRYHVPNFYYIPAPGKTVPVWRDCLILLLCRPFFKKMVLHWHAAGLADWLETPAARRVRPLATRLLGHADLSIVLSQHNAGDAGRLHARRICRVQNGLPDPCPDFAATLLPRRQARADARRRLQAGEPLPPDATAQAGTDPHLVKVLFLAHCLREKGLFDTLEAVFLANQTLQKQNSPLQMQLSLAGSFPDPKEEAEFNRRLQQLLAENPGYPAVQKLGFVSGPAKQQAFAESDLFCFPSYYHAESFGLVLLEAMAHGLPLVTTRWRSLPELLPEKENYPGLVDIQSPAQIAASLIALATNPHDWPRELRRNFETRFSLEQHLTALAAALRTLDESDQG